MYGLSLFVANKKTDPQIARPGNTITEITKKEKEKKDNIAQTGLEITSPNVALSANMDRTEIKVKSNETSQVTGK